MTGKYGNSIGKMKLSLEGFEAELTPQVNDKVEWLDMVVKHRENPTQLMKEISNFMKVKIARDVPPVTDEEKEELDKYVVFNAEKLQVEFMIFYRLATREGVEEARGELKNEYAKAKKKEVESFI